MLADDGHVICAVKPPTKGAKAGAGTSAGSASQTTSSAPATDASPAPGSSPPAVATGAADEASGLPGDVAAATTSASPLTPAAARTLASLLAGPPGALPRLPRLATTARVREGEMLKDQRVGAALRLIAALPHSLRDRLAVVESDPQGQTTLRFATGMVALWGDADRLTAKALALRAVLDSYRRAGKTCTFIDVSVPDRVLARPVFK